MASCGENRKSTALTVRTLRAEHFYSYNVIKHRTFSRKLSHILYSCLNNLNLIALITTNCNAHKIHQAVNLVSNLNYIILKPLPSVAIPGIQLKV